MSEMREFVVLHSLGGDFIRAKSAGEALRRCCVPLGFRDARGIIDLRLFNRKPACATFTAMLAQPALPEAGR